MHMIKKILSNPFVVVIALFIGFALGRMYNWDAYKINTEVNFNLFDIFSLLITVSVALYIAKVLKRDLQHDLQKKQLSRDMWINRLCQLETILDKIEKKLSESEIYYDTIVSSQHQLRSKLSHMKSTLKESENKLSTDNELKQLMDNINILKRLLTETPVHKTQNTSQTISVKKGKIDPGNKNQPCISVNKDGIVTYSRQRLLEINRNMELIDNNIFLLKLKIASFDRITLNDNML